MESAAISCMCKIEDWKLSDELELRTYEPGKSGDANIILLEFILFYACQVIVPLRYTSQSSEGGGMLVWFLATSPQYQSSPLSSPFQNVLWNWLFPANRSQVHL